MCVPGVARRSRSARHMWWLGEPILFLVLKLVWINAGIGIVRVGNAVSSICGVVGLARTLKHNSATILPVFAVIFAELCEDGDYERGYFYAGCA